MRSISRLIFSFALFFLVMPMIAQEETEEAPFIDPASLTQIYIFDNVTLYYPVGLQASAAGQIRLDFSLDFDRNYTDYISIFTPASFEVLGISSDTLEVAAQNVFSLFAYGFGTDIAYEEAVTTTTIAGLDAYYFFIEIEGRIAAVYTFMVGEEVYAVSLLSRGLAISADAIGDFESVIAYEEAVMVAIIENMMVGGEPIAVEIEATSETVGVYEIRPAPAQVVELPQDVTFVNDSLTLSMPAEWVFDEATTIISTNENVLKLILEIGPVPLPTGDVVLQFFSPSRMNIFPLETINIAGIVNLLVTNAYPNAVTYKYDLPYPAYFVPLTGIGNGAPDGSFFIIVQLGENIADVAVIMGVAGDYNASEATIISIVNTLVYTQE